MIDSEQTWARLSEAVVNHTIVSKYLLTAQEREALELFSDRFDAEISGRSAMSPEEESRMVDHLLSSTPGAREALDRYTVLVNDLDEEAKRQHFV